MKSLNINESFKNLLRPLTQEEKKSLTASILSAGKIINPIIVFKGTDEIVDGYHRYRTMLDASAISPAAHRGEDLVFPLAAQRDQDLPAFAAIFDGVVHQILKELHQFVLVSGHLGQAGFRELHPQPGHLVPRHHQDGAVVAHLERDALALELGAGEDLQRQRPFAGNALDARTRNFHPLGCVGGLGLGTQGAGQQQGCAGNAVQFHWLHEDSFCVHRKIMHAEDPAPSILLPVAAWGVGEIQQKDARLRRVSISPSPWRWIPTLYFAQGLPYVAVMTLAVVVYKNLGVSNTEVALYTSWLYLPWVIKPLWSPWVDLLGTKRRWIVGMQFLNSTLLSNVYELRKTSIIIHRVRSD